MSDLDSIKPKPNLNLILPFLLGVSFLLALPIFNQIELNEDVTMVTGPVRDLIETGNLKKNGGFVPFQALRSDFSMAQGYWYNYFGPVLLYFPAFKIFGSSDFSFYFTQTILICFLFFII